MGLEVSEGSLTVDSLSSYFSQYYMPCLESRFRHCLIPPVVTVF